MNPILRLDHQQCLEKDGKGKRETAMLEIENCVISYRLYHSSFDRFFSSRDVLGPIMRIESLKQLQAFPPVFSRTSEKNTRNVKVSRIEEVLIQVSDIERSLKFYRGLGIPFSSTSYGDDSFEAKVGHVRILLHPDFDDSLREQRRGAGILIHFWVPDADLYCQAIRNRGIILAEEPKNRPWGRHFAVVDPDGYRIEFLAPVSRKAREPNRK